MKSSYGARLEAFLNLKKIKRTLLSTEFGKSPNVVGDWIRGKANPPLPYLEILHIKYGLNLNWLATGVGDMLNENVNEPHKDDGSSRHKRLDILESVIENNRLITNANLINTTNTEKLILITDRLSISNQKIVDTNTLLANEVIALNKS